VLGIALGVAVVAAFVFWGSEQTIDSPRLSDGSQTSPSASPSQVPVVRVVDGAPPASGPARLEVESGARARFRILSDSPTVIAVPDYGIRRRVDSSRLVEFRASRPGRFAVVVAGSGVAVASLRVSPAGE
jgi:hypothetical protein